ncbi:MAG: hypothetical protein PVG83_05480 [Acidimicrobiia bacterium]
MAEPRDRVDHLLRRLAGDPEPGPGDEIRARSGFEALTRGEQPARFGRRGLVVAGFGVVLAIVAAVVIFGVGRPSPASAAMEEIARAVEEVSPLSISDTEFVYQVIDSEALAFDDPDRLGDISYPDEYLVYSLPRSVEVWRGASGSVQMRVTVGRPTFFSSVAETAYYEAGLDESDAVGETFTQTFTGAQVEEWPADIDELDEAIRDAMVTNRGLPDTVEYLDVALDIVEDVMQPPDVRASTLHLIGNLDGLKLVESNADEATFSVEYVDRGLDVRLTFSVGVDGYLRFHELLYLTADDEYGIPAGTVESSIRYSTPRIVEGLE